MFLKLKINIILLLLLSSVACSENANMPTNETDSNQSNYVEKQSSKSQPIPDKPQEPIDKKPETLPGEKALVISVTDGDTIQVSIGGTLYKVRYIGVDTPETKHPSKPVQYYGKEASAFNEKLVSGKEVRLVKDISDTDRYGRLLRYVYVGNVFVNAELVYQGYASASTYPPDVKYSDYFLKLEREARNKNKGLWGNRQEEPKKTGQTTIGSFIGNKNSKKLHNLAHTACKGYVNSMNEGNKVSFSSASQANKAGYYECAKCY